MHWTERKGAKAALGNALRALGWKLYGWHDDKSNSMTDYYSPAHWDGVAVKGEFVAAVDVGWHTADSGRAIVDHRVEAGPCSPCNGTGKRLREAPASRSSRSYALIGGQTFDVGDICEWCAGSGQRDESRAIPTGQHWPTFQANPPRRLWHVETGGRIVASGIGLGACDRSKEAAAELAAKIDAATQAPAPRSSADGPTGPVSAPKLSENAERGGVELRFPAKPEDCILAQLKAAGWRWSRFSGCWYVRASDDARTFARSLIA